VSAAIKFVCVFVFIMWFHKVLSRYVWLQGSGLLLAYKEAAGYVLNRKFKQLYCVVNRIGKCIFLVFLE